MANEILKDEILSEEELDNVAGGGILGWVTDGIKSVGGWVKDKMIDPVVDVTTDISKKVTETVIDGLGTKKFLENVTKH